MPSWQSPVGRDGSILEPTNNYIKWTSIHNIEDSILPAPNHPSLQSVKEHTYHHLQITTLKNSNAEQNYSETISIASCKTNFRYTVLILQSFLLHSDSNFLGKFESLLRLGWYISTLSSSCYGLYKSIPYSVQMKHLFFLKLNELYQRGEANGR